MAINSFLIFDEQGKDMMTDIEYGTASQRLSGVVPGLADAELHNKLYRQTSIMAHAIGRVLGEFGLDAPDNDVITLARNIKSLFCFNVLDAYPIGSLYISASGVNPSQLFGGTWERVSGRFLLGADTNYPAGSTGGEASHTLTTSEIPAHNHGATSASAGAHTHAESNAGDHTHTVSTSGQHAHTRGTMNITGTFPQCDDLYESAARGQVTGAFYWNGGQMWATAPGDFDEGSYRIAFDASRTWSGATSAAGEHSHSLGNNGSHTHTINSAGGHTHTISTSNTGGGGAHNNMPPYLSVYVWKRIA